VEADRQAAKQAVFDAAVNALRAGADPATLAQLAPFSWSYIRRYARDEGVPPAKGGPKPRNTR